MQKLAFIFDLDGTLIDSSEDLALAVNGMLRDFDYPPISPDTVREFIGDGTPKLAERTLRTVGAIDSMNDPEFDTYYQNLMGHYEANIANKSTVYPGVYEFL
ncbi:MAG TPA: HAD hydrolase-like protein, partial [bacterium]|nr:HAD hydrolase-like protein [bacterium]